MDSPIKNNETTLSLRVRKGQGEETIRLLRQMKLIDTRLKVRVMDDSLVVPLLHPPDTSDSQTLQKLLGPLSLSQDDFQTRFSGHKPLDQDDSSGGGRVSRPVPVPFDIIGDIAVLELEPASKSQESIVSSLRQTHRNVRAIFTKAGPISGEERIRPLRHLAGENRTTTIHREFGCTFEIDISRMFFSPRLSTEHMRVAGQVSEGEYVLDMFAGVGPFSILIAKARTNVSIAAIDSNPYAVEHIRKNAKINKVEDKIKIYTGDANKLVPERLSGFATRVIMNHPSQSKNFLRSACLALGALGGVIHYYTFCQGTQCEEEAESEFRHGVDSIGYRINAMRDIRRVREVAPFTWQIAVDAEVKRK